MAEAEVKAVAADWADALGHFPQWVVEEACRDYLRENDRKPTIAAIRKLCQHHFAVVEFTRQKAMRGPVAEDVREPISEEEQAVMRDRITKAGEEWLSSRKVAE